MKRSERSKRVSFHREVTVKEFIKKHGNSSIESDVDSPDLYRAPISHCGGETMNETCCADDSDMELTDVIIQRDPGELTTMFNVAASHVTQKDESMQVISREAVEEMKNGEMGGLDTTVYSHDVKCLEKKVLSLDNSVLGSSMMLVEASLNDSESSLVRRSARLSRLSNETTMDTSQYRTPQINLTKSKKKSKQKKNLSQSDVFNNNETNSLLIASKSSTAELHENVHELSNLWLPSNNKPQDCPNSSGSTGNKSSVLKEKKNVSLLSACNGSTTKNISSVSKLASIDLLENSTELSNISLANVNTSKVAEEKAIYRQKLIDIMIQKKAKLKELKLQLSQQQETTTLLWKEYDKALEDHPHPFNLQLLECMRFSSS